MSTDSLDQPETRATTFSYRRQLFTTALPGILLIFVALVLLIPDATSSLGQLQRYFMPGLLAVFGLLYASPFLIDAASSRVMLLTGQVLAVEVQRSATNRGFHLFVRYTITMSHQRLWTYHIDWVKRLERGQTISVAYGRRSGQILALAAQNPQQHD